VPHILISYRREDSDAIAGRIRDRIASRYGDDCVFMDIDSIPFGLDFREQVQNALMKNDLVVAIIGPKWTGAARGHSSRIHEETDPVRIEIETALTRGIPVIPVLVGKASIPQAADLPPGLRSLSYLNAAEVSAGRDFNQHVERLLRSMERFVAPTAAEPVAAAKDANDPSAMVPRQPRDDGGTVSEPAKSHSALSRLLVRCSLRFDDKALEYAFIQSLRSRFYFVGQTSMMFGIVAWVVFGATDLLSGTAGLGSIQFRFMLALPLMLLFFGASFTQRARRQWQPFFATFAVVGISCMLVALLLVGPLSWFRFEQATMSFMLFMALIGLAPFTTLYMLGVGAFILALHASYVSFYSQLDAVHALFYSLFVAASYVIVCTGAWVRETSLRSTFAADAR
jgi:TIR domain